jgi:proline racemase
VRIYKEKDYIVISPAVLDKPNAQIVSGERLNSMVAEGKLKDGDCIYHTSLVATVKEKRELVLQEVGTEEG